MPILTKVSWIRMVRFNKSTTEDTDCRESKRAHANYT
jgi:hypothetical protein